MDPSEIETVLSASVLIVEDEGIVARDLHKSLHALGYRVVGTSPSGTEAVAKAEKFRPDLVLMDIRLRGEMDGIEAARRIREGLDVPIVFLTAYADPDTLERAAEIGPYAYVLKPFDDRELQVTLMMALCKHRAFAQVVEAERIAEEQRVRASLAEENLRGRDDFLSVAAHELRTPVAALQLQLAALEKLLEPHAEDVDPRVLEKATRAGKTVAGLASLVEGVLDVSRIALGQLSLRTEWIDLTQLVRDVVAQHEELAERAGCPLRLTVAGPVCGRWDRTRLRQVMTNLLSNAIKFGAGKPIEVTVEHDGAFARVRVADHGGGIDPADAERIMQRFERGVSYRQYGGLGLGLFVAHQIVKEHGGAIEVSGTPGEGAVFVVELPCDRDVSGADG